ncbi:MAG TPA: glycosyl hydrolase 115 family protein [Dysgonamonadaceae bacterium]|nr:glycosyl hydrolase 115 family protein [Dysgonamonadaceae bacterium]
MKSKLIYIGFLVIIALSGKAQNAPDLVCFLGGDDVFALTTKNEATFSILSDSADFVAMQLALANLQNDFLAVAGKKPALTYNTKTKSVKLIVGTIGKSEFINQLANKSIINKTDLLGKHEKFIIQTVKHPFEGIDEALVIAGSNKRGTVYGIYELSRQIGVSPWYYWADVPVRKSKNIYIKRGIYTAGEPAVEYRGIFINDEEPALGNWVRATFGGFNHPFYEKVFELILRLKGNFLWPAMWGKAFYDDDPQNAVLADEMGVVIGTSHHEPMARAHVEWSRYGKGEWNYQTNKKVLKQFWTEGFKRAYGTECLITVGMRGDGDEPMSEESNIKLLEKIISDQRSIISEISGKDAAKTPQVWALYKEVQDYYDKGMRVPDDVTLLLCDDNWGNVRKLPLPDAPKRKGGYGMYYHFDYVGGPRNYKWINVSQVQRIWEQMSLTYQHGVDKLWIVNVGDLKPMEYPISFFLDMAWNPNQFTADNLREHTEKWCAEQFGEKYAKESARLIDTYTKYNHRITPELLNDTIYSLENYNEFQQVTSEYVKLALDAFRLYQQIPDETKDAFDELVLFPINACSNLYEMYFAVAKNKQLGKQNNTEANTWADEVKKCFERDSLLTLHYNTEIAGGKWKHMMDQIRIGYTYWHEPKQRVMPEVKYVTPSADEKNKKFVESDGYISIEAEHFNRAKGNERIEWKVIPNLGKTLSGVTTFPQNEYPTPEDSIYLEYDVITRSTGNFPIHVLVSPTLNFNNNKGLRYGISVDNQEEKIVNMNGKYDTKLLEKWQAQRINETITTHVFQSAGKHVIRFRVLDPGIVLQKIIIDTGSLKKSYLGAPESKRMVD